MFKNEKLKQEYFQLYDQVMNKMPVPKEEFYVRTKWCDTHVIHCGMPNKKRLVILHPRHATSLSWYYNILGLAPEYDIYMLEAPGEANKTRSFTDRLRFADYMGWLEQTLGDLDLGKVLLLGWGFGGFLAVGYAIRHPERIEKIMALSPTQTFTRPGWKFTFSRLALFSRKEESIRKQWEWLCEEDSKIAPYKIYAMGMKAYRRQPCSGHAFIYTDEDFRRMQVPCKIAVGSKDRIYVKKKIGAMSHISSLSRNISFEIVEGAHGFWMKRPSIANQMIMDFLVPS